MAKPDEESLARSRESALRGDPASIEHLLHAYLPQVRAFVRMRMGNDLRQREESLDIVQSTCRRVLAHDAKGLQFEEEGDFRAWLFTAALNNIKEKHRFHHAQKRDVKMDQGAFEESAMQLRQGYAGLETPSQMASAREQIEHIESAIDQLDDDQREVISLCRLAGLSNAEVGVRMGRSAEAVRKLLARALYKLCQEIE
jgi:RNA polymerase sigma-70 factor, ECF subfamily